MMVQMTFFRNRRSIRPSFFVLLLTLLVTPAAAQVVPAPGVDVYAQSEHERYLRTLQLRAGVPHHPWSIRSFSRNQVNLLLPRDSLHPWAARYPAPDLQRRRAGFGLVAPRGKIIYNSSFPFGYDGGPEWAGRGVTTVAQAGFQAHAGPLSLVFAPIAFRAENARFVLYPTQNEAQRFRDPLWPQHIDLPQRFGEGAYARVDLGESSLRFDLPVVTVGLSTARQHWGPMVEYPLLMGTGSGGFPHGFVGTGSPLNIGIGRVHAKLISGRIGQSEFSPFPGDVGARLASGLVAVFSPRFLDGLEVGGGRFYHQVWPAGGPDAGDLLRPLEGLLKSGLDEGDADPANQVAGVFARWVFPRSGLEFYGEFIREDHAWDLRHFLLEPEDLSGYGFGVARVWERDNGNLRQLRVEVMNGENATRGRAFHGGMILNRMYTHSQATQGHTNRGQLLAAREAFGGAGLAFTVDEYDRSGRTSVSLSRTQRLSEVRDPEIPHLPPVDVMHSVGVERLLFRGRYEATTGVTGTYEMNRNFQDDAFNLHLVLQLRAVLR
ncbi:MAG: hypothetical protein H0U67_06910 [Gemmatimonadetes bacterium]|nr:hypothetical protein [Gemmatimonadota bacterium]